jgi:hypothetical protein
MLDSSEGYACHFCVRIDEWARKYCSWSMFVLLADSSTVVLLVLLAGTIGFYNTPSEKTVRE